MRTDTNAHLLIRKLRRPIKYYYTFIIFSQKIPKNILILIRFLEFLETKSHLSSLEIYRHNEYLKTINNENHLKNGIESEIEFENESLESNEFMNNWISNLGSDGI